MRRAALSAFLIVVAAAANAASSHFLDRNGTLWSASSQPEGLVLVGERDEQVLVRAVIPFDTTAYGASESEINVVADELTGKVAVVWQRSWFPASSEIMLAVLKDGQWERIEALVSDFDIYARFPAIRLSRVRSLAPEPDDPTSSYHTTVIEDSFLNVVWWTGYGPGQHGVLALVRLTAAPEDPEAITTHNLDLLMAGWGGCATTPPATLIERQLFASKPVEDRAYLFHGSRRSCLFQLLEISFTLSDPPAGGTIVTAQRKRHTPVFGVRKLYAVPDSMSLEGARIVVGDDLNPVAYRVVGPRVEYISSSGVRWSPRRSLPVDGELTLDQAIPLIEQLAR